MFSDHKCVHLRVSSVHLGVNLSTEDKCVYLGVNMSIEGAGLSVHLVVSMSIVGECMYTK